MDLKVFETELLKLSIKEKILLLNKLLDSLQEEKAGDAEETWIKEALNRYDKIRESKLSDSDLFINEAKELYSKQPGKNSEIKKNNAYDFTVLIEKDEDGKYLAVCPALQGCYTEGETEEEAKELIEDAIRLHVEARLKSNEPINQEISTQKIRIAI